MTIKKYQNIEFVYNFKEKLDNRNETHQLNNNKKFEKILFTLIMIGVMLPIIFIIIKPFLSEYENIVEIIFKISMCDVTIMAILFMILLAIFEENDSSNNKQKNIKQDIREIIEKETAEMASDLHEELKNIRTAKLYNIDQTWVVKYELANEKYICHCSTLDDFLDDIGIECEIMNKATDRNGIFKMIVEQEMNKFVATIRNV